MLQRVIKPQIIKRFCHHSRETNYSRMLDKLNDIQIATDSTANKIVKLEKDIHNIGNVLAFNYFFTVIFIPASIFFTR
jgi:hypothetical protein